MSVIIDSIGVSLPNFLAQKVYSNVFVLVDKHTKRFCYPSIKSLLPKHQCYTIMFGEEFKILDTCQEIWEAMTDYGLDRHSLVINLGGGVIGDMGGFCAATFKRGVDFIQIPTTLLSQVDASVGGKLGVDFKGLKNHIGSFQLPNAVLIDPVFLKTLPENELRSGFAEIIKHCLIADAAKWNEIRTIDFENQNFGDLIAHSVKIKKDIVAQDPTEKGLRKILNFGHTLGHAVETFYLNSNKILHGEAVALGMICEAFIGYKKKMITEMELMQIEEFIFSIYGKIDLKETDLNEIIALTQQDKKNNGTQVRASILKGIGSCAFDININNADMKSAFKYYIG